ncbi:MAG: hypothetical protein KC731_05775 [Myxococcales bacterium]|nr:hypothetical protein [Myxococcales bacterium]
MIRGGAPAVAALLGTAGLLVSDLAHACPSCATRDEGGIGMSLAIGGLMVIPYVLALAVVRFIRSGPATDDDASDR